MGGIVRGLVTDIRSSHAEVKLINKKIKPREKQFCGYFVCTGSAEESARRAGYRKNCRLAGERLLCDEKVLDEIERLIALRRRVLPKLASAGYYRMAFGGVSDALRLLYSERPTEQELNEMDLFMISEIKKPKDGMLEIKFFDRLKALEKLGGQQDESAGVAGLFDAIGRGAQSAVSERDD